MLTLSLTTLEILILFILIVSILLLSISALLAPHRSDAEKESSYETGLLAILGQTRAPFTISYYVTAVLFLVFDLEVAFIFPSLITFNTLEIYGYWILTVFFIVLTFGFVLELGTGILDLTSGVTSIRPNPQENNKINLTFILFTHYPFLCISNRIFNNLHYYNIQYLAYS